MVLIPSYPKVWALGHRNVRDITTTPFSIEEKIDGSQISFGVRENDKPLMRTKNREYDPEEIVESNHMFAEAARVIISKSPFMSRGFWYRGEYLRRPKHNVLDYDRRPKDHIILYDVTDEAGCPLPRRTVELAGIQLGLEVVPEFMADGTGLPPLALADKFMDRPSVLGGPIEGVVFKNRELYGSDGKFLAAKFVGAKFKEKKATGNPGGRAKKKEIIPALIESLATEARWRKAVYAIRDEGTLEGAPRDIGRIMKKVQEDLVEEEGEWIGESLYTHFRRDIHRGVVSGIPEWYKRALASGEFDA